MDEKQKKLARPSAAHSTAMWVAVATVLLVVVTHAAPDDGMQWDINDAAAAGGGGGGGGVRGSAVNQQHPPLTDSANDGGVPAQAGLLVEVPPVLLRSRVVVVPVGVELPGGSTQAVWTEWAKGVAAVDLDPHPNHR